MSGCVIIVGGWRVGCVWGCVVNINDVDMGCTKDKRKKVEYVDEK
jgi:hypothetical protein